MIQILQILQFFQNKRELFEDITNADRQTVPAKKSKSEIMEDSE